MKKYSVFIFIMLFALILSGCSNNILENTETGKTGPAWDVTMKVPVADSQNNFGDLVGADKFNNLSLNVVDGSATFTIEGSEGEEIVVEESQELPPLEVSSSETFSNVENPIELPIVAGTSGGESFPFPFPFNGMTFAKDSPDKNELNVTLNNTGSNSVDDFQLTVTDENETKTFFEESYIINDGKTKEAKINFDGEEINFDKLKFVISYAQGENSGDTAIEMIFSGLDNLRITKAENIEGTPEDIPLNFSLALEKIGDISAATGEDNAKIDLIFNTPNFKNMDFNFSNIVMTSSSDDQVFSEDTEIENSFYLEQPTIEFGELSITGKVNFTDGFSYDSSESIGITTKILGSKEFPLTDLTEDLPIDVVDNDLVYKSEAFETKITQEQIDKINKYVLSEKSFIETEIDNSMGIGIKANLYLANTDNKTELYKEENKVNKSLIEIEDSDSLTNRFSLGDPNEENSMLNMLEEAVQNKENVYLGIEFILGSINDDGTTEKTYSFTDDQNIDIKSHLELTVKVNQ